jgi:hypothetical protein
MKSVAVDLPNELIDRMAERLSEVPAGAREFSVWAMGRAVAVVPEAPPRTGREAMYWLAAEALWHDIALDNVCREWVATRCGRPAVRDNGALRQRRRDAGEDVVRSVYGDAKYAKLVDPEARLGPRTTCSA